MAIPEDDDFEHRLSLLHASTLGCHGYRCVVFWGFINMNVCALWDFSDVWRLPFGTRFVGHWALHAIINVIVNATWLKAPMSGLPQLCDRMEHGCRFKPCSCQLQADKVCCVMSMLVCWVHSHLISVSFGSVPHCVRFSGWLVRSSLLCYPVTGLQSAAERGLATLRRVHGARAVCSVFSRLILSTCLVWFCTCQSISQCRVHGRSWCFFVHFCSSRSRLVEIRSHVPHAIDGTPLACQSRDQLPAAVFGLLSASGDGANFVREGFGSFFQEIAPVGRFDLQTDLAGPMSAAAIWKGFRMFLEESVPVRQFYFLQDLVVPVLKAVTRKGFGFFLQEIGRVSTCNLQKYIAGPLHVATARKSFGTFLQDFAPARKLDLHNNFVGPSRAEVMRLGCGICLQEMALFRKLNLQNDLVGRLRTAAVWKGFGVFFQESAPVRKVDHQTDFAVPLLAMAIPKGFSVFFQEISSIRLAVHHKAVGVARAVCQVCIVMRMGTFASLMGVRVGEASNPGPWHIEVRNVVSADKHVLDLSGDPSCVAWTETSAGPRTLEKLHRRARAVKSHLVHSAALDHGSGGPGGKGGRSASFGALVCSRSHAKSLHSIWDAAVWQSSRIADSLIQLDTGQVRVVAVYGYHSGIPEAMELNEALLHHVFATVSCTHLPTIIVGDLNCDVNSIDSWRQAACKGYVDVAHKFASITGSEPENTYRGVSRLDYILCNSLAWKALRTFDVDPCGYTDHAILHASFDWDVLSQKIPRWSMPMDFAKLSQLHDHMRETPMDTSIAQVIRQCLDEKDVQGAFDSFVNGFEKKAQFLHHQVFKAPLPSKFLGRFKGRVEWCKPARTTVQAGYEFVSEGVLVNAKLRAVSRLRQLHFLLGKGINLVECSNLWNKLLREKLSNLTLRIGCCAMKWWILFLRKHPHLTGWIASCLMWSTKSHIGNV